MAAFLGLIAVFIAITGFSSGKRLHVYTASHMNWFEAFEHCRKLNQNLVSIMNKEEHAQLANAMHSCGTTCFGSPKAIEHAWTSGTDLHQKKAGTFQFQWKTTGTPVSLDLFAPDHPPDNFEGNERCLEAFDIPRENQVVLNDCPCLRKDTQYVVCQSD